MNMRCVIGRGTAQTIEDAVEAWKTDHADAVEGNDVDELVAFFLEFTRFLADWHKDAHRDLFADKVRRPHEAGVALGGILAKAVALCDQVAAIVQNTEARGFHVEGAARFQAACGDVVRLHQHVKETWPMIDAAQVERSRAQVAAGQFRSVEDILRGLQAHPAAGN